MFILYETKVIIIKHVIDAVMAFSTDLTHKINSLSDSNLFLNLFPLVCASKYLKTRTEISNWYLQSHYNVP